MNCELVFLFFTYVHMIVLCLCIVSRRNKYNTIYFFKRINFLSFFSSSIEHSVITVVCWNFMARSGGGNLTMSDLDFVAQIPSSCSQHSLGSHESKHKPLILTDKQLKFWVIFFPLPAGPPHGQLWNRKWVRWKDFLLLFFGNLNTQLGCSLISSVALATLGVSLICHGLWNDNLACTSEDPPCSTLERLLQYQVPSYHLIVIISTCIFFFLLWSMV